MLGALLILGPIVGGMFAKVAAGKQMLDEFAPHLEVDALARYNNDITLLRTGAAAVDTIYAQGNVKLGEFPGIDDYRARSTEINDRAAALLAQIGGAEPDYRRVADIGGFDRVPFMLVLAGLVALYGGGVLWRGGRGRAPFAAGLVVVASIALVAYPFVSNLPRGTRAGERMLQQLDPVMTKAEVRTLQLDFVAMVHAVGLLDTGFRRVPQPGQAGTDIATLVEKWPTVSSAFAELVGTMNDNVDNFNDLKDLNEAPGGLSAMPWLLVGLGVVTAGCAIAAVPRRQKETS